jgi:hypothetical protein
MALVVVVVSVIKLVVILVNPRAWIVGVGKRVYGSPVVTRIICVILGAIAFYYLVQELSIVQIFAAFLVFWFLLVIGLAPFGNEILSAVEAKYPNASAIWKQSWITLIIWIVLMVWVLKELFM